MRILTTAAAICASLTCLAAGEAPPSEIYASVYSANSWKEHNFAETGMYRFPVDRYERATVMIDSDIDASGGGVLTGDFYFCTQEMDYGSFVDVTHYIIDSDKWTTISTLRDGERGAVASDMVYDPQTAKIYGCFNGDNEGDPMVFGTLNEGTGARFKICDIEIPWIACAIDRNGALYAVDMAGNLYSVDKVYGTQTLLGNLGFTATNRSSGAIDPRTGIFYVAVTNSSEEPDPMTGYYVNFTSLYAVDIDKREAKLVYEFGDGEVLGGMFIPGEAAPDGAPAAVEDLALEFAPGSLTGTATFTVPTLTFDGKDMSGAVNYSLRTDGAMLAEGTAECGERMSVPVTFPQPGNYRVFLTLSNDAGKSPRTRLDLWIGEDSPAPLQKVDLEYSGEAFNISWDMPQTGQNGGFINPDNLTFSIVRQPGDMSVAEGLKGVSSFTDPLEMPDGVVAVSYEVTMKYGDKEYAPVATRQYIIGSEALPWIADFVDENSLDTFTRFDLNGDKIEWYREWEFYIEVTDELIPVVSYPYSSSREGADDWLITPPFRLEAGKNYKLSYESFTDYEGSEPKLGLWLGSAPHPDSMKQALADPVEVLTLVPTWQEVEFQAPENGIFHIGFHACSEPDRSAIAIRSMKLVDLDSNAISAPEGVSGSMVIKASKGVITVESGVAAEVNVYRADGTLAAALTLNPGAIAEAQLPAGLYIVAPAGQEAVKVLVR